MSEAKLEDTKYAVFLAGEKVSESFYKDLVTGVMVAFCVYISQGSTFWTFITGLMFLLFMFGKISLLFKRQKRFRTKKDLQAWVDSLGDDQGIDNEQV